MPQFIEIRGARVNNLKNIDVDIPLGKIVGICGVSGSGKSSLALGVLYSEGFRKYLNALSAYSKRRISQPKKAKIDSIRYLPSTIALRQRPAIPGVRSTVGTMTEVLNVIRLMFSRLGNHPCPNGHLVAPTIEGIRDWESIRCPECGVYFPLPGAESFSFNSDGACSRCDGLGFVRIINPQKIVPDENLTIEQGAVSPWRMMGRTLTPLVVKELGVRIDVPYKDLTDEEKRIILHGEEGIHRVVYSNNGKAVPLNVNYENAYLAVMNSSKSSSELTLSKVERYFDTEVCPECRGSRLNSRILASRLCDYSISEVSSMSIGELCDFAKKLRNNLPPGMEKIAIELLGELNIKLEVLSSLGVSYLTVDRLGNSLSNGELQRIQLAKIIQNDTTGVLYVFDEPSIGLHPINIEGIVKSIRYLAENGNTVVFVDHNTLLLREADYLIEMGQEAGENGGQVICSGSLAEIIADENSVIGQYFVEEARTNHVDKLQDDVFEHGAVKILVKEKFNLKNLEARFPVNKLSVVAGISGSGKTTLVLECLVKAILAKGNLPDFVEKLDIARIKSVQFIDASPIGKNSRSTVATYTGIFDLIRRLFAGTETAIAAQYTESWFSYNNVQGRCPACEGLGEMNIDIQYLPDLSVPCSNCNGTRYDKKITKILYKGKSIVDVLAMTVHEAITFFAKEPNIQKRLINMEQIGLGYLTLGEGTPELSGGEAQRMRLSMEINKVHSHTLFVLDEPTIGLHPKDVEVLIRTLKILIEHGATVVVIEHDLDVIKNADYVIEMGEKGGPEGGKIIASGTPDEILKNPQSLIAKWMR
jgi:excinuclease ABC subunit A